MLVVWEVKRADQRDGCIVEGNKLIVYLFASNTDVQHLGGADILIAAGKYDLERRSKN